MNVKMFMVATTVCHINNFSLVWKILEDNYLSNTLNNEKVFNFH